jgi:hypothetical protein
MQLVVVRELLGGNICHKKIREVTVVKVMLFSFLLLNQGCLEVKEKKKPIVNSVYQDSNVVVKYRSSQAEAKFKNIVMKNHLFLKDPNSTFPTIDFERVNSDYVEIIRCNSSFKFTDSLGKNIRDEEVNLVAKKSAWLRSIEFTNNCFFVQTKATDPPFLDFTVDSGSYYYVLNPCLKADNTLDNKDRCSYNLFFSNNIIMGSNAFSERSRILAKKLIVKENAISELAYKASALSYLITKRIESCESKVALEQERHRKISGFFQVGVCLATAGVAKAVAGAGANGQQMGCMMGTQVGAEFIELIPGIFDVQNKCGSYEMDINQLHGYARENAKKYAAEFEFEKMMKEYTSITFRTDTNYFLSNMNIKSDGGLLQKARNEYLAVLKDMADHDSTILDCNLFLNKVSNEKSVIDALCGK